QKREEEAFKVLLAGSFGDSRYCNFLRWGRKDPRSVSGGHRSITDGTGSACHCHRNSCYCRPDGKRLVRRPSTTQVVFSPINGGPHRRWPLLDAGVPARGALWHI